MYVCIPAIIVPQKREQKSCRLSGLKDDWWCGSETKTPEPQKGPSYISRPNFSHKKITKSCYCSWMKGRIIYVFWTKRKNDKIWPSYMSRPTFWQNYKNKIARRSEIERWLMSFERSAKATKTDRLKSRPNFSQKNNRITPAEWIERRFMCFE